MMTRNFAMKSGFHIFVKVTWYMLVLLPALLSPTMTTLTSLMPLKSVDHAFANNMPEDKNVET